MSSMPPRMHTLVLVTGLCLVCCGLLPEAGNTAHAQRPDRTGKADRKASSGGSPSGMRRSVVLKFAAPPANAGVFSSALREVPRRVARLDTTPPRDRWIAPDKAKHLGGSFLLALGGQYVFENKAGLERDPALALSVGTGAALGVGKELYDWRRGPASDFSAKDLAADGVGIILALGVILL